MAPCLSGQKASEVAEEMRATWSRRRAVLEAAPSFQPALTPRGQQRIPRPLQDLSEGDRLRQEYHKASLESRLWLLGFALGTVRAHLAHHLLDLVVWRTIASL